MPALSLPVYSVKKNDRQYLINLATHVRLG
jgi:hypothetical protein